MISTRLPKRAAIIGAVTVVLAGTAAAAAANVVPSPWASPRVAQTKPFATTTTAASTTTGETTTVPSTEAPATTEPGATDSSVALYPGRDYGLCTAWTNGAPKRITNPAFSYLVDQAVTDAAAAAAPADEAATRAAVDAYCEKVIADKKSTSDDADDEAAEAPETATSVAHTMPTHPAHPTGKPANVPPTSVTPTSVTPTTHAAGDGKGHGKP